MLLKYSNIKNWLKNFSQIQTKTIIQSKSFNTMSRTPIELCFMKQFEIHRWKNNIHEQKTETNKKIKNLKLMFISTLCCLQR